MKKGKKIRPMFALLIALLLFVSLPLTAFAVLTGSTSDGWDIFDPSGGGAFRYGPNIIINADGSIDSWYCSPGDANDWDWIRYRRSTDGGQTWTESVVLKPTTGGADDYSTCDPGVVKFGGYYYLSYTSTLDSRGTDNDVFVARSTSPGGPYDKWNGSGWGGNPQPFITHTGPSDTYGAGESSLVIKDGTLYIYYSWLSRDANGKYINQTRVLTASTSNANWPGNTTYQGVAIERERNGDDSTDHKYVPSMNKFIAIGTSKRFTNYAFIKLYESSDGITYRPGTLPKNFIKVAAHNAGISGNESGHFDTAQSNFIAYAYGVTWAYWYTALNPFTLTNTNLPAVPRIQEVREGNGQLTLHFKTTGVSGESYTIKYGTSSGNYSTTVTGIAGSPYTITSLTNGTPYYFVVSASNASGNSANSPQVNATPYDFSASPRSAVSASSQLTGWESSKAIDADPNSNWSSVGHTSETNTEWIRVDTGANRTIKRVTLTPRLSFENTFPKSFKIQVSTDGTNWLDASTRSYRLESPHAQNVYTFNDPIYGRYVRVYATKLGSDGSNYYFQLGDFSIEHITYNATSSTNLGGWEPYKVIDGISSTVWSSNGYTSAAQTEWISLNTGTSQTITGVKLTPRGYCFPVDFKLQYSSDGSSWTDIPGQSYTNYPDPGTTMQAFKFGSPITAKYVRLYATKLRADQYGNYYAQLADFKFDTIAGRTATASSSISGWEAAKAVDNHPNTYYSSVGHSSASNVEWVSVDMGSSQVWSGMTAAPRPSYAFPVDFKIQYSADGTNWTTIPGHSHTHYAEPNGAGSSLQEFPFSSLVTARYFRIYATKLRADDFGNYYLQLGDITVDR